MRKFIIAVVVVLLLVGALVGYLYYTTPSTATGLRFPLTDDQRRLLGSAPHSAEAVALIPTAAVVIDRLHANPITRDVVSRWSEGQPVPRAWMIGGADVVAWRSGKQTGYLIHLDPVRAALVRTYLLTQSNMEDGGPAFYINAGPPDPLSNADLVSLLGATQSLPAGDALVIQRKSSAGAFPPIDRPAATSVQIGQKDITITSRARFTPSESEGPGGAAGASLPQKALLSASFARPPRVLGDLNRIFGASVSTLFNDGGALAIYEVKTGTLLPRPKGVLIFPATDDRRASVRDFESKAGGFVKVAENKDQLLVAFDDSSIPRYTADTLSEPASGAEWNVRIDAENLLPIVKKLADSDALRFITPRLSRQSRELYRWMSALDQAGTIDASLSRIAEIEQLHVHITAK